MDQQGRVGVGRKIVPGSPLLFRIGFNFALFCVSVSVQGVEEPYSQLENPFRVDIFSHHENYRQQIDLNGEWKLRRDPEGVGKDLGWEAGKDDFSETLQVPGAPQAQGIGEPHRYQRTAFSEPFWIRRNFEVPERMSKSPWGSATMARKK